MSTDFKEHHGSMTFKTKDFNRFVIEQQPMTAIIDADKLSERYEHVEVIVDGQRHLYDSKEVARKLVWLLGDIEESPYADYFRSVTQ